MKIIYQYERSGLNWTYINPNCSFGSTKRLISWNILGRNSAGVGLNFSDGFVLYEILPQTRNLFSRHGKLPFKVNLPYMYFGVRYFKSDNSNGYYEDGSYIYPGPFHAGLQLFFSANPIKSFDDYVCPMPSDTNGIICVDHKFDYSEYKSIEKLSSEIIGSWYRCRHHNDWRRFDRYSNIDSNIDKCQIKKFLMNNKFDPSDNIKTVEIPDNAKIMR